MKLYQKRQRGESKFSRCTAQILPYAVMLGAFYICGAIVGNCCAFAMPESGLSAYGLIAGKTAVFSNIKNVNILALVIGNFKYAVMIFALGFFLFGLFLIPAVISVKGFEFAFCVACFYRAAGFTGLKAASCALLVQNAVLLPGLLILAGQACFMSKNMFAGFLKTRTVSAEVPDCYFKVFGGCMAVCAALCLWEVFAVPALVSAALL